MHHQIRILPTSLASFSQCTGLKGKQNDETGRSKNIRAITEGYACADARQKFLGDFVAAWQKVMNSTASKLPEAEAGPAGHGVRRNGLLRGASCPRPNCVARLA